MYHRPHGLQRALVRDIKLSAHRKSIRIVLELSRQMQHIVDRKLLQILWRERTLRVDLIQQIFKCCVVALELLHEDGGADVLLEDIDGEGVGAARGGDALAQLAHRQEDAGELAVARVVEDVVFRRRRPVEGRHGEGGEFGFETFGAARGTAEGEVALRDVFVVAEGFRMRES